jgi:hypothetical protein
MLRSGCSRGGKYGEWAAQMEELLTIHGLEVMLAKTVDSRRMGDRGIGKD